MGVRKEVHLVCGTSSEALRLAPVILALRQAGLLEPVLIADPASEVLAAFGLTPEITRPTGGELVRELDEIWSVRTPAAVIVVADTAAAMAAFWRRIPVVHLDAGLRSEDPAAPFPQEDDRRLLTQFATVHLVSSPMAAMNLLDERIPVNDVLVTGSTLIDAALTAAGRRLAVIEETAGQVGDGLAGRRAAQATAALLGLASPPEPLPVSPSTPTSGVVA